MNEQQRHQMILEKTHSSGEEEWQCPSCGRRMLINWQPEFQKTVLEPGDEYAMHSATKGLLPVSSFGVTPVDENTSQAGAGSEPLIEESRLAPWQAWLDEVDFNSLWDSKA